MKPGLCQQRIPRATGFLALRREASLKQSTDSSARAQCARFLALRREASLKPLAGDGLRTERRRFLALRREASLKLGAQPDEDILRHGFPRASARGLIEARATMLEKALTLEVSSRFGARPH